MAPSLAPLLRFIGSPRARGPIGRRVVALSGVAIAIGVSAGAIVASGLLLRRPQALRKGDAAAAARFLPAAIADAFCRHFHAAFAEEVPPLPIFSSEKLATVLARDDVMEGVPVVIVSDGLPVAEALREQGEGHAEGKTVILVG